jgi:glycosyltransferase involved in cell wall biosynthesis
MKRAAEWEDRPLRICMLTTFYPPHNFGGDGIFVRRLAEALARRGHVVEVIHALDAYRFLGGEPQQAESIANPKVHSLHSKFGGLASLLCHQTGRPVLYASRIREILDRGRFDVLHYHNPSLLGGPGVFAYGNAVKLYTTHEHWLVCPTHTLWRYQKSLCTRKTCLTCTLRTGRPPQLWRYTRLLPRMIRQLDAILCPSRFTCAMHQQNGIQSRIFHLPHFVPDSHLRETDPAAPPYFLVVGRLEKLKGIQTLFPAFAAYPRAELWIAGAGGLEGALRRRASNNPRIRFLGQRSQLELNSLYRNAVALILPSLCYEAFGLVLLEAFAQETPAIARRIGTLTEVIEESGGGYLYSSQSELIEAMSRLQQDSEQRKRFGLAGREAVLSKWSEQIHISNYLDLIKHIRKEKSVAVTRSGP